MRTRTLIIPSAGVALCVVLVTLATRSTGEQTTQSAEPQATLVSQRMHATVGAATATAPPALGGGDRGAPAELTAYDTDRTAPSASPAPQHDPLDGIEPAKRPLILAIRDRRTNPAEKRRAMLQALEDSGETEDSWAARAPHVFETWRAQFPEEVRNRLTLRELRCFRAGCAVDVSFESEAEYGRAAKLFPRLKDSGMPHGGRIQTPLERRAGTHGVASWIMLSPTEEQLEAAKGV